MKEKNKRKRKNVKQDSPGKLDREICIIHCIAAKLSETEALTYLDSRGHHIERATYYSEKKKIEERRSNLGHKLAAGGLFEQHMIRIENLEEIEREFWINYHREPNPFRKSVILEKIQNIQPFISSTYDYIKEIMLEQAKLENTSYAKEPEPNNSKQEKAIKA